MKEQATPFSGKLLKWLFFLSFLWVFPATGAQEIRIGSATAVSNFNDLVYHHATMRFHATDSRGWRPEAWTAGVGVFQRNGDSSSVYTFGPAWRLDGLRGYFVDAAFSVTYLDHHRFREAGGVEDFGQNVQFMSRLSVGIYLDRARSWSLETGFLHVSNGGLSETNPGADFFSVDMLVRY